MTLETTEMTVKEMLQEAAVYVHPDQEAVRVLYCEDEYFVGEGEETGESYQIEYTDVDPARDLIYKLVLIN
jgi:hypothetical protein